LNLLSKLEVVYSFNKRDLPGTLLVKTTTIAGITTDKHWLDEIYDVQLFVSKDLQGGSNAEVFLYFTKGKELKLFSVRKTLNSFTDSLGSYPGYTHRFKTFY
jgi:hypothetical protein